MKKGAAHPIRKIARRGLALCLTLVALWLVWLTADLSSLSGLGESLGQSADFVAAALAMELGEEGWTTSGIQELDHWQKLVLGQSLYLQAGVESAAASQAEDKQNGDDSDSQQDSDGDSNGDETELENTPQSSATTENIVARTIVPTSPEDYDSARGIYINNYTDYEVDVDALLEQTLTLDLSSGEPEVLIIHTHTTEAYAMDGDDVYEESDTARTLDMNYNVVRVGNEVTQIFTELGLSVIHDTGYYDYPAYNGSYSRSAEAIESYLAQYPTIKIIIDIHRDALVDSDGTIYKTVTEIDGIQAAQVCLVIGTDGSGQAHPNWRENLALAVKLQQTMNNLYPTLARPIALRNSRYNQNYTTGAFLVEIGTHGNTLEEALSGARLFARAAAQVLLALK